MPANELLQQKYKTKQTNKKLLCYDVLGNLCDMENDERQETNLISDDDLSNQKKLRVPDDDYLNSQYLHDFMVLLPVNLQKFFCFWNIVSLHIEQFIADHQGELLDQQVILRLLYRENRFAGYYTECEETVNVQLTDSWYFLWPFLPGCYSVDLGFKGCNGRFFPFISSNILPTSSYVDSYDTPNSNNDKMINDICQLSNRDVYFRDSIDNAPSSCFNKGKDIII